ncbi:unnamed protein product, partial [Staurois parvus]
HSCPELSPLCAPTTRVPNCPTLCVLTTRVLMACRSIPACGAPECLSHRYPLSPREPNDPRKLGGSCAVARLHS